MYLEDNYLDKESYVLRELLDLNVWIDSSGIESSWFEGSNPQNVWEGLIIEVFGTTALDPSIHFEYWINHTTKENPLGWHQDKDEELFETTRQKAHPTVSTVFYGYPHLIEGGYLEISPTQEIDPDTLERIEPRYNRLVMFNPEKFHRVSPILEGDRFGFQVNAWEI